LRDKILQSLKNEKEFSSMINANLDGYLFSVADVFFLPNEGECLDIFRIAVIKYGPIIVTAQKNLCKNP